MDRDLVSVIINSFNGANFIEKSVSSVLSQTYSNLEIIFWDNASQDNTKEIITNKFNDSRLKYYFSKEFLKLYDAKNKAIHYAKGKYLAFLDVDDWWERDKLDKQISAMKRFNFEISCTNYFIFNEKKIKSQRFLIKI